jgi:diguanylate cyclase (GGDEF)-like protein
VISLKKILDGGADEQTLLRVIHLLLQGLIQHAIEGDAEDVVAFRASIQKLTDSLTSDIPASELLVHAGAALHTLEDYNRRTARYLRRPHGEWQAIVAMLTSALAAMSGDSEESARRLREIASVVRSANGLGEVHKIRLQLSECLAETQLEARRRKSEATSAPAPAPADTGTDPVTGFATRTQAEEALAQACQTDPASYVVVVVLDRLQIFNMRFGHSVGDEVLRYFGGFLRGQFRATDQIFRWSGPTLVALLPRPVRLEIVRDEVARLMDARCEHTVQTASRAILLPIAPRWAVFPTMAAPRLLIHKIDTFAAMKAIRANDAERADLLALPPAPEK